MRHLLHRQWARWELVRVGMVPAWKCRSCGRLERMR